MLAGLPSSASLTPQFPLLLGLKPTPPISHRRLSGEATGRHPAGSRGKESGGSLRAPRVGRMRAGRAGQGKAGQSRARQGKSITVGAFPRSPARPRGHRDYGRDPPAPSARRCRQPKGTRPGPGAHPPGRLGAPSGDGWPWKRPDLGTRLGSGCRGGSMGWGTLAPSLGAVGIVRGALPAPPPPLRLLRGKVRKKQEGHPPCPPRRETGER